MKRLKDLKALRFAWWHVYCPDGKVPEELSMLLFYGDSPCHFFSFAITGTPDTVYKLARAVDISHLSLGNPGGGVWSELKSTPGLAPKWAIVKKALLWVDEDRYKTTVWKWLTGKGEDILSAEATPVMTQQG